MSATNHAERAAALRERLNAANGQNFGRISVRETAPVVDETPAPQFMSRIEYDDSQLSPDELEAIGKDRDLYDDDAHVEFRAPELRARYASSVPQSPLELAREHLARQERMVAGLKLYRASCESAIAAKQQEIAEIDATLATLGAAVEVSGE